MSFAPVAPRRFPHPSWAWPRGGHDLLLQACLAPEPDRALAAARAWFASHDIDAAEFREHRLLVAIAARFGKALADLPEYPRLAGLQRMLWTKARMALREAEPALREMTQAGVPVMVLKGAARIALNADEQKARVSHDTDILVPPQNYATALEVLTRHGWQPSTGETALCLQARLATARSINLFYGHFGDIDLHQWAYAEHRELDSGLWARAAEHDFFGARVRVPRAEDRIALALASSALDAHAHSDWLVDCARALQDGPLDGALLLELLEAGGLLCQAEVTLSYLRDRIGIGCEVLPEIAARARRVGSARRMAVLVQMKPRCDWTLLSKLARGLAKQARLGRRPGDAGPRPVRGKVRRLRPGELAAARTPILSPIALGAAEAGRLRYEIVLAVELGGLRRRVDFELNTDAAHLARLRMRDLFGRRGWHAVTFTGEINLPSGPERQIWIEARPSKTLRNDDPEEVRRYAALPMRLLMVNIAPHLL